MDAWFVLSVVLTAWAVTDILNDIRNGRDISVLDVVILAFAILGIVGALS